MIDIVEFKKWCNYNRDAKLDEVMGDIFVTVDALAAEIAAMKQQEPVAYLYEYVSPMDGKTPVWRAERGEWNGQQAKSAKPLYALPEAKGEEK